MKTNIIINHSSKLATRLLVAAFLFAGAAFAADKDRPAKDRIDIQSKDVRNESQKNFDRNMENAKRESERQRQEKNKEAMRDKSHDNRLKVGKDVSIGVDPKVPGMNIKKTTSFLRISCRMAERCINATIKTGTKTQSSCSMLLQVN